MATNVTIVTNNASTNYTLSTGARGPAGAAGGNSVTSATTSDGTAALYLDSIQFETSNGGPTQLGEMAWESTDGSIDAQLENGVIAAIAEDGLIRVRNTSGVPIAKGDALRYTGTNGATGRLEVGKWVGANVTNAREFMGFAACAMNDNSNGYAQWFGKLEGITTTGGGEGWIDGQIIYAVPGASATITDTAPTAAGEYVVAAAVINAGSGTSGSLFVRPSFAKNIASADIVDASSLGLESTAGKAALYGAEGQISAPYFFAAGFPDVPNATYGISNIATVDAIGNQAATMNFPTTGNGTLMLGSNNLSDLSSASTARTNLGAGTAGDAIFQAGTYSGTGSVRRLMGLDTTDSPTFAGGTFSGAVSTGALSPTSIMSSGFTAMSFNNFRINLLNRLYGVVDTGGNTGELSAVIFANNTVSSSSSHGIYVRAHPATGGGTGAIVRFQNNASADRWVLDGAGLVTHTGVYSLTGNLTASGTVSAARMSQATSTAADPTTTEYPTSGQWGVHKNTSTGNVFLAYNDGGSIKKVQLT